MKYFSVVLLIIFTLSKQIDAQTPLLHEASLFVDSAGQVFTKADQPAYFFISPAESDGELIAIPSSDKDANPMHWDGHGVHYIAHRDLKLNKTIRFRIMADGVAPVSKLHFSKGVIFNIDNQYFVETGATATALATDKMAGVQESFISIDGQPYITMKNGIAFNNEGTFSVIVYSVDNVGNAEEPKEFKISTITGDAVQMQNIYFDLNSAKLKKESVSEIDKLVTLLKKYPKIRMELSAHTDSRGESKYNLELSNARAQAVVDYIIGKGIHKSRLLAKGYGDTQPLNECKKGTSCSEDQHKLNRRVEFRISRIDE